LILFISQRFDFISQELADKLLKANISSSPTASRCLLTAEHFGDKSGSYSLNSFFSFFSKKLN